MPFNIQDSNQSTTKDKQYHREKSYMSFELWFIYFDSLFARPTLRITKTANQIFKFYPEDTKQWTKLNNLPQLTQSYQFLQIFYTNIKNWVSSNCILGELESIESHLNEIFVMMQIEKKYARDFWDSSPRRIQASICHLYMFFQSTIEALLPDNKYTVKQYQERYHLVTRLNFLQELVNQLLSGIEKIYKFMIGPFFKEQRKLTVQFFNHVNHLFMHLPQLRKNDFQEVPKLLQYLKINNPIQISNEFIDEKFSLVRGRRATVADRPKRRVGISPSFTSPAQKRKLYKQFNGCVFVINKRSRSESVHVRFYAQSSPSSKQVNFTPPKMFSFPKYIYNYSLSFQKQLCSVWQRKRSKSLINREINNTFSFGNKLRKNPSDENKTCNSSGKSKRSQERKVRKYINSIVTVDEQNQRTNRFQSGTMRTIDAVLKRLTKSLQKQHHFHLFQGQKVIGQKQEKQEKEDQNPNFDK